MCYQNIIDLIRISLSPYSLPKFIKDYSDCIKLMQNVLLIAPKCIYIWWWHFNVASLIRWYHQHCHRDTTFYRQRFCYIVQLHISISSIAFITSFVRLEGKSMQFLTYSFDWNRNSRLNSNWNVLFWISNMLLIFSIPNYLNNIFLLFDVFYYSEARLITIYWSLITS